jgi:hypothetical protein
VRAMSPEVGSRRAEDEGGVCVTTFDPHPNLQDAIDRWHANHRDFTAEDAVIPVARPPMHTVEIPRGVRIAATRIGCTIAEYFRRQHDGERWCPRCPDWRANWRSAEGRTPYCPPCMRAYRVAHRQAAAAQAEQIAKRRVCGIAYAGPLFSKRARAS